MAQNNPNPEQRDTFTDKLKEKFDQIKKNEKFDDIYSYARSNTRDTIAYVLLILGIVMLFFDTVYGGLLIGAIAGLYFNVEILWAIKNVNYLIEREGMVRSLILGGTLLGFFISAPAIFIGAAVAVALKEVILPESK